MKCEVAVPAKINLSLDVIGEREDGYHLLETVMQSIGLFDKVTVSLLPFSDADREPIRIDADRPTFPLDCRNTCHKAARLFLSAYRGKADAGLFEGKQIRIHIDKKIPQAAGLAGGSADAAAVLTALNRMAGSIFSDAEICAVGAKVGADVPFCLLGGTALCSGIGDVLEPLPFLGCFPLVLVKPDFGVSTPWVYERLDRAHLGKRPDTPAVARAICEQDIRGLFTHSANVLESVTLPAFPVLSEIRAALLEYGAQGAMMSGSGPTVFGLFQTQEQASAATDGMRRIPSFAPYAILQANTVCEGPRILPPGHTAK